MDGGQECFHVATELHSCTSWYIRYTDAKVKLDGEVDLSDLQKRIALLAWSHELGPQIRSILATSGSLRQMIKTAETTFFNEVLREVGGLLHREYKDSRFTGWLHNSALTLWGAEFVLRIPDTFNDVKVRVRFFDEGQSYAGSVSVSSPVAGGRSTSEDAFTVKDSDTTTEVATKAFRLVKKLLKR